jgi:hypothetical protein
MGSVFKVMFVFRYLHFWTEENNRTFNDMRPVVGLREKQPLNRDI